MWGRRRPPVTVTNTIPPADVIPRDHVMVEGVETLRIEHAARNAEAAAILERALAAEAESARITGVRQRDFEDACLDALSALRPSAPGSRVLREVPPVPHRYGAPVIPGRAS